MWSPALTPYISGAMPPPAAPRSSSAHALVYTGLLGLVVGLACSTLAPPPFEFFVDAKAENQPRLEKIHRWQLRSNANAQAVPGFPLARVDDHSAGSDMLEEDTLRTKMTEFRGEQQRRLARRINEWSQVAARRHYKKEEDETAENDHWPTFGELLENDGDDCDGLDLLSYRLLLDFGFDSDHVYRAVFRRNSKGTNHMVTLWFESETDPWVLDATRAATPEMKKISEVTGWTPTVMFNENRVYNVVDLRQ